MLAAENAAELPGEVADLVGDGIHPVDAFLVLQADHGPDVQAADAGVAVVGGLGAVVADDLVEPADEVAHGLGVDGGVLHEGQRLGVAVHAHQQAQTVLAHVPDVGLGGAVQKVDAGVAHAAAFQVLLQVLHLGSKLVFGLAVELDGQDGAGVSLDDGHGVAEAKGLAGAVQHVLVHDLDGRGARG